MTAPSPFPAEEIPSGAAHPEELGAFADESIELAAGGYYTRRWTGVARGTGAFGFNWFACVFGSSWCLWRKQYRLALGVFVGELACAFMVGVGYWLGLGMVDVDPADPIAGVVGWVAIPIVRIPLGASANRLYFARAQAAILEARSIPTQSQRIAQIRRKGGTSPLALAFGVLANVAMDVWSRLPAA